VGGRGYLRPCKHKGINNRAVDGKALAEVEVRAVNSYITVAPFSRPKRVPRAGLVAERCFVVGTA
jgi:hypothetical protein